MMTLETLTDRNIPLIGFGPGIAGYNPKLQKQLNGIAKYNYAVLKRFNYRITCQKYVDAVAHALGLGYRLIDYSSAYGDGKLPQKEIKKSGVKVMISGFGVGLSWGGTILKF